MQSDLIHPKRGKENRKVGRMPTSYASRGSCPSACPLKGNGCYAEGAPVSYHWNRVTAGKSGVDWETFCEEVKTTIGPNQPWRYGTAGDLPGEDNDIDPVDMGLLVDSNLRRPVIAFTHKPVLDRQWHNAPANRSLIGAAVAGGFHINLSSNDVRHADELADLGLTSVVTVLPLAYERRFASAGRGERYWTETIDEYRDRTADLPKYTPAGRRIAVCPATYTDTTCASCLACTKPRAGGAIIGFPAHGASKHRADTIANGHLAARDVPVGQRWTFPDHRNMAQVMAEEEAKCCVVG